jgi:CheY-like chemotaxis protein
MSTPHRKILIADDNLVVLKVLSMKLSAHGFHVVAVAESDQIIGRATEEMPHLILLDQHFGYQTNIGVPDWDGLRILRWMNRLEHLREIPVVIITGDASPELKTEALKFGAAAFLHKPLDYEQLIRLCINLSADGRNLDPHEVTKDTGVTEPAITAVPVPACTPAPAPVADTGPRERNWVL